MVVSQETTAEGTPEIWLKQDRGPCVAKVLTHQHPKPVAHPTMLDHVVMPDHVGNGEAGPLMQAGPVEPLHARPTEAGLVGHRTPPTNDTLCSKISYRGTGLQGRHLKIWEERGNKGSSKLIPLMKYKSCISPRR